MSDGGTKKIGLVLSGCGVNDGAEIHEATLTLLALDRAGAQVVAMAPNVDQMHVIDHLAGVPDEGANRNVLVESARIARGDIRDLATVRSEELDALVFPGGFGAAKNLCTFAVDGAGMTVLPEIDQLIKQMYQERKPLGFICIAPVIAAKVLGELGPTLTIGNDPVTAEAMVALGARHSERAVDEIEIDDEHRIVSTPAYMLGPSIAPVARGIDKLVDAILEMA